MKWPWSKPRQLDPSAQAYLDMTPVQWPKRSLLSEVPLVVLDAETTGMNLVTDRILSVAAVEILGQEIRVETARAWLVYQSRASANDAVGVHGILPSETAEGSPEAEVIAEILPLLAGHIVIGHHIAFDMGMLSQATQAHYGLKLRNPVIDTAMLAMQELEAFKKSGYPNQRPPSLDDVCSQLEIPIFARHTASGDTFATAEAFLLLSARLRKRLGRPLELRDLI